jgi:hypothetical protein
VTSGLEVGDEVVLNPRVLLSEKEKAAPPKMGTQEVEVRPSPKAGKKADAAAGEGKKGGRKKAAQPQAEGQ